MREVVGVDRKGEGEWGNEEGPSRVGHDAVVKDDHDAWDRDPQQMAEEAAVAAARGDG